jgi:RNA polymerase sigma-70 factor (ECF subfamily)
VSDESPDARTASFNEEALPHLDAVYRFAVRLSGNADEAEDLVQETFLRAFRSWDHFTPGTRAKSWLFTICRNVFLRQRERGARHERVVAERARPGASPVEVDNPIWASVADKDPEGEFFASIVDEEILAAIDALPEEYRSAVILSDQEGLSYDEISALMGVPVGTVKSRLFRGRRRLQQALYQHALDIGFLRAKAGAE